MRCNICKVLPSIVTLLLTKTKVISNNKHPLTYKSFANSAKYVQMRSLPYALAVSQELSRKAESSKAPAHTVDFCHSFSKIL